MKLRLFCALLIASAIPFAALAQGKDAAGATVTINGKRIPKSRVDFIVKQQVAQGAPDNDQTRRMVLDRLINIEVVVQEADRKGFTKSPEVQIELARQQLIFQAFLQDYFKTRPIKEEAARAEYDRVKTRRGNQEYKARHILVEKESEAKDIIEQLNKGGKFEELAKRSKDIGSKDKGGELDWEVPANYTKPFADALVKLEKGKTTDAPVQSQFGLRPGQAAGLRKAAGAGGAAADAAAARQGENRVAPRRWVAPAGRAPLPRFAYLASTPPHLPLSCLPSPSPSSKGERWHIRLPRDELID